MLLSEEEREKVLKIIGTPCLSRPPGPYTFYVKSWKKWKRKFRQYVQTLEDLGVPLDDPDKIHLLMHLLGEYEYAEEVFRILEMEGWSTDMSYDQVIRRLTLHIRMASRSILYKRLNFHRRMQLPGESVTEFVRAIKFFAQACDFAKDNYDLWLRDKVVVGIISERARQKIFTFDDMLTYNMAVQIAFNDELREARSPG